MRKRKRGAEEPLPKQHVPEAVRQQMILRLEMYAPRYSDGSFMNQGLVRGYIARPGGMVCRQWARTHDSVRPAGPSVQVRPFRNTVTYERYQIANSQVWFAHNSTPSCWQVALPTYVLQAHHLQPQQLS